MKKLLLTIAIVLGMGMMSFAQEVDVYEEAGLFGKASGIFRGGEGDDPLLKLPEFGDEDDVDADAPLGSGIAVLMGLGAAYLVGKRRKED